VTALRIENYWFVVLAAAASAAAGAALALASRRRRHRAAREAERKAEVKSWENEGGTLASTPVTPAQP
jgi:hypothetical protein